MRQISKLEQWRIPTVRDTMMQYVGTMMESYRENELLGEYSKRNLQRVTTNKVTMELSKMARVWQVADNVQNATRIQKDRWATHMGHDLFHICIDLLYKVITMCKGDESYIEPIIYRALVVANARLAQIDPRSNQPNPKGWIEYQADDFLFETMSLYLEGENCDFLATFFTAMAYFVEFKPHAGTFMTVAERQEKTE